jgi:ABC-type Zn uptake system ZnuABC Zn-binding protein ZnuA
MSESGTLLSILPRQEMSAVGGSTDIASLENIANPRLMQQLAREAGAVIGGTLYSDSLSDPQGPAATYLDMFRHNVDEIATAFTS